MGQIIFSGHDKNELRILGLGSCIGLCVFDPVARLGAVAHVVLPEAGSSESQDPGRYADTAVPYLLDELERRGAMKHRLRAAIAGGAQLFTFAGASESLNVGERNVAAVKRHLAASGVRLMAEDTGGKTGRTVVMDARTGAVRVKQPGQPERELVSLLS